MRIAELRARERYDDILLRTLSQQLSVWHGEPFSVANRGHGQAWLEHRIFSAYVTAEATREVRRFLADQVRHTSNRLRRLPQFIIGTAAATRLGIRAASSSKLFVSPHIPNANHLAILPGNRRIRFFDLAKQCSRVVMKDGFSSDAIDAELRVRGSGHNGPFPPILDMDQAAGWFTEPLVSGRVLARIPSRTAARSYRDLALRQLTAWAAPGRLFWSYEQWWAENTVAKALLGESMDAVNALIGHEPKVEVQPSHGDFQPGNILVQPSESRVWLLDWEFYGIRSTHYDGLVLLTGLRWPGQAAASIEDALSGRLLVPSLQSLSLQQRKRAVVMALIEDITLRLRGWDGTLEGASPPEIPYLIALIRSVIERGQT